MQDRAIINMLMKSPVYFSLPLPQRLQMTRFIRECGFDPDEINDIFLQSFSEDWPDPPVCLKN